LTLPPKGLRSKRARTICRRADACVGRLTWSIRQLTDEAAAVACPCEELKGGVAVPSVAFEKCVDL
jgi:hypothetical protein